MLKLLIVLSMLFSISAFAQPRQCSDAQMKSATTMDVRANTTETASHINTNFQYDTSTIVFMTGFTATNNFQVYFYGANNFSCQITLKGVVISLSVPQNFPNTTAGQVVFPMVLGCADKLGRNVGTQAALNGFTIRAVTGKNLGDLGLIFNTAQNVVNITTEINHPAIAGFTCAR